jgi:hypothetical protein
LRSLLPDRLIVNEYIRISHPAFDALLGLEGPFDTSDSIPADRDLLVHKVYKPCFHVQLRLSLSSPSRNDMVRCTFLSLAVWYTLLSFYGVTGDRKHDIKLYPTAEAVLNSNGSAREAVKEAKQASRQVKSVCGNCMKPESDFPDRIFKSCSKCRDTPSNVMYCSR